MAVSNGSGRLLSDCCCADIHSAVSKVYAYECEKCGKLCSVHQEPPKERLTKICEGCGRSMPV